MKSIYYLTCGIMSVMTLLLFVINHYGREFIQDYWIERMWYGDLARLYQIITTFIVFVDIVLVYFAGLLTLTKSKKDENN